MTDRGGRPAAYRGSRRGAPLPTVGIHQNRENDMATTTAPTNGKRMSGTNGAVARSWVDGYAGGKANNMSNVGGTLYSYQTPIGRRVLAADGRTVFYLLSDRSFSMTTKTKHLSPACNAIGGAALFYVDDVAGNDDATHERNTRYMLNVMVTAANQIPRSRSRRGGIAGNVARFVREILHYRSLAGLDSLADDAPDLVVADWIGEKFGEEFASTYRVALAELTQAAVA